MYSAVSSIMDSIIREKRLGGAILDVFINEPLPPTNELWELENVRKVLRGKT